MKTSVKKLKADNLTSKINKLEDDFRRKNSHNIFKTVRELEGLPKRSLNIVKDAIGAKQTHPNTISILNL